MSGREKGGEEGVEILINKEMNIKIKKSHGA